MSTYKYNPFTSKLDITGTSTPATTITQWSSLTYTSRTNDNVFVSNGVDLTNYKGYGLKVTDDGANISYNIISDVSFSTNSTVTVVGDVLPTIISTIEICHPIYIDVIEAPYNSSAVENTNTDIFDDQVESTNKTDIDTRLVIDAKCELVYVNIQTDGAASTTDYIMNIRLNSDVNDLLTSNLTVNGTNINSGVTTNRTYSSLVKDDILRTRITTAGSGTSNGMIRYFLIYS